jgi:hypothetical protein
VLGESGGFDGGEEAVERTHRLFDLRRRRDPGLASAFGDDHAVGAELPQRLADGVPAHAVLLDQRHLAGELLGEFAGIEPGQELVPELPPEGLGAHAVECSRRHVALLLRAADSTG